VLQCVAASLQGASSWCVLQQVVVCCSVLQQIGGLFVQGALLWWCVLQRVAACCSVLQQVCGLLVQEASLWCVLQQVAVC